MVKFNIGIQGVPASDEKATQTAWNQFAAILSKYGWETSFNGGPEDRNNPTVFYFTFSGEK